MKVNDLHDIIVYYVRVNQDKEVNMQYHEDDPRHRRYKVKGKKMLPKSYNLRHQQAVRLAIKLAKRRRLDAAS